MELDIEKIKSETSKTLFRNKIILILLLALGILGFWILYANAPALNLKDQKIVYRIPVTPLDLYKTSQTIQKYTEKHYYYVIFSISYLYVLLQSFSIPGPPLLNILAGALFGFTVSFALATFCGTLGSILCFVVFETIGKGIVIRWFPDMIVKVHQRVYANRHNLFFYLLSLRVAPFVPKWVTSVSSPIIGVPLKVFGLSAFFGLMPHNFIHTNAGVAIASMQDFGLTLNNMLCLAGLGVLSLIPTFILKDKNKKS
jgi:uncharacterized membrane protein YdjX (TVP38/TMEM64 family)